MLEFRWNSTHQPTNNTFWKFQTETECRRKISGYVGPYVTLLFGVLQWHLSIRIKLNTTKYKASDDCTHFSTLLIFPIHLFWESLSSYSTQNWLEHLILSFLSVKKKFYVYGMYKTIDENMYIRPVTALQL